MSSFKRKMQRQIQKNNGTLLHKKVVARKMGCKSVEEYNRRMARREKNLKEMEVLETLSSICLYLEFDAHFAHRGRYDDYFSSHAKQLRIFSESLRDELVKEDEKNRDRRG